MYSLFIDTHDKNIIEVLYKNGQVIDKNIRLSERNHSDFTMPMLEQLLKRNNITVHELNEILVCNGPGSFTGVRIGITIAKTLAYTLNIPIKTITSLECLAVSSKTLETKIPIIKDVKGVFFAIYDENNFVISEPSYINNQEFKEFINEGKYSSSSIIDDIEYDYEAIFAKFKGISATRAHEVNPLYIKIIEALKND